MTQGDGLGRQITIQWGAAVITGIFLLVAGLVGGRAWEVRVQANPSTVHRGAPADGELAARDAQIQSLQRFILDLQRRTESDQADFRKQVASLREALAARDAEHLAYRSADHGSTSGQAPSTAPKSVTTETATPEPPIEPADIRSATQGDFAFAVQACKRSGDVIRCTLTVKNISSSRKEVNLCSSYLIDNLGRQPGTAVDFGGGSCGPSLESNLPRRFEMAARLPADARSLNIVLADGSWGSFPGSAILRDVPIMSALH